MREQIIEAKMRGHLRRGSMALPDSTDHGSSRGMALAGEDEGVVDPFDRDGWTPGSAMTTVMLK